MARRRLGRAALSLKAGEFKSVNLDCVIHFHDALPCLSLHKLWQTQWLHLLAILQSYTHVVEALVHTEVWRGLTNIVKFQMQSSCCINININERKKRKRKKNYTQSAFPERSSNRKTHMHGSLSWIDKKQNSIRLHNKHELLSSSSQVLN